MMGSRTFSRGVHPRDEKHWTKDKPVETAPLPDRIIVPLSQHIGAPAKPLVKKGDQVKAGQAVAEAAGFVSAPIHASTSGTVKKIDLFPHPMGTLQPAIEIEVDGDDSWIEGLEGFDDPFTADPTALRKKIVECGIVGLGGATFPTHVKLSPPPEVSIDSIILNGVECEPYLTADHRLMLESPEKILNGLKVILTIFGLDRGYVGIEMNKPDAIELMDRLAKEKGFAAVVPLQVKYPQGAEKQLIKAVLDREVPSAALPMAVGAVVQNVATAAAIWDAAASGRPLVERILTVTGPGINEQKNLRVRTGTPIKHLVDLCGGLTQDAAKVILGGPMMGISQHTLDVPAIKGTSGILCLTKSMAAKSEPPGPCIGCGRCVDACPMALMPTTIRSYIEHDMVAEADEYDALDCMECGSCSFGCPARLPLVQSIRYAKGRVLARRRELAAK